jgi:hypothetical protein
VRSSRAPPLFTRRLRRRRLQTSRMARSSSRCSTSPWTLLCEPN